MYYLSEKAMNQSSKQSQSPTWRWLWERLLLPLNDKKDGDIVRAKPPHLHLVKNQDEDEASEE
jgi:hypothetical protein